MKKMKNLNAKTGLLILATGLSLGLSGCNKADNEPKEQPVENAVTTTVEQKAAEQEAAVTTNKVETMNTAEDMQATPFVPENTETENTQNVTDNTKSQAELDAEAEALAAADDVTE